MNPKLITRWGLVLLFIVLAGCTKEETELTLEEAGQEVITLLQNEEYQTLHETWFDKELQESLSAEELANDWKEKTSYGEFVETGSIRAESRTENIDIVEAEVEYTRIQFDVRLIFNENMRLVGFSLSDGVSNAEMPSSVTEEEIVVGEGTEHELGGLLTLPTEAEDAIPVVILVHGSGPSDRDETVFAYKPFRDLAWGLAEQGIAVIRYDRRTFIHGSEPTVYGESVEDAIRATELVKSDSRIDEEQVFLVGHSLGGMLAPRIDAQGGDYAGLVILAGTPRKLWEVIYDQASVVIDQITDEDEYQKQVAFVENEYEKAKSLQGVTDEEAMEMIVFGTSGYYYKEMDQYDVSTLVKELNKPLLIMQGEDDFQVYYDRDFVRWKELLDNRDNVSFISYPGLNHFFIESEGPNKGTVEEYKIPNRMNQQVINDIGQWILEQQN